MRPGEIKADVLGIEANDWDKRLFDNLISLPDGTSPQAKLIAAREKPPGNCPVRRRRCGPGDLTFDEAIP